MDGSPSGARRIARTGGPGQQAEVLQSPADGSARGLRLAYFDGARLEVVKLERGSLQVGEQIFGPCLVTERHSTTVVEPGWRVWKHEAGGLIVEAVDGP